MVQVAMGFLSDVPNMEKKMSVIETLRTVTEGKVGTFFDSKPCERTLTQ